MAFHTVLRAESHHIRRKLQPQHLAPPAHYIRCSTFDHQNMVVSDGNKGVCLTPSGGSIESNSSSSPRVSSSPGYSSWCAEKGSVKPASCGVSKHTKYQDTIDSPRSAHFQLAQHNTNKQTHTQKKKTWQQDLPFDLCARKSDERHTTRERWMHLHVRPRRMTYGPGRHYLFAPVAATRGRPYTDQPPQHS